MVPTDGDEDGFEVRGVVRVLGQGSVHTAIEDGAEPGGFGVAGRAVIEAALEGHAALGGLMGEGWRWRFLGRLTEDDAAFEQHGLADVAAVALEDEVWLAAGGFRPGGGVRLGLVRREADLFGAFDGAIVLGFGAGGGAAHEAQAELGHFLADGEVAGAVGFRFRRVVGDGVHGLALGRLCMNICRTWVGVGGQWCS